MDRAIRYCVLVIAIVGITAFLLCIGSGTVFGKTISVDDSGGADFTKIKDAVTAAEDGDHIFVHVGTYDEKFILSKRVHLEGAVRNSTIITAHTDANSDYIILINTDHVTITNISIQGKQTGSSAFGIKIYSDWNIITGVSFREHLNRGFYLNKAHNNSIIGNYFVLPSRFTSGISIWYSYDNLIHDNIFVGIEGAGISMSYSGRHTIRNNNLTFEGGIGIYLRHVDNSSVLNNICEGNQKGIISYASGYNLISDNILNNTEYGISLEGTNTTSVFSNELIGCGFYVYWASQSDASSIDIPENNTINGKPFIFINGRSNEIISSPAPQICVANSINITIRNQNLSHLPFGIHIQYSEDVVVEHSEFWNNSYGIIIRYSMNCRISKNSITQSLYHGIEMTEVHSTIIFQNNISANGERGIHIWSSHSNTIDSNHILGNNEEGIWIEDSNNNSFINNSFHENEREGVKLSYSNHNSFDDNSFMRNRFSGLSVYRSELNHGTLNTCSENYRDGIEILGDSNIFVNNDCRGNHGDGIHITGNSNTIESNNCSLSKYNNGIHLSRETSYMVSPTENNVVKDNHCFDNDDFGINIESTGHNTLVDNICSDEDRINMKISGSRSITLHSNTLIGRGLDIIGNSYEEYNTHDIAMNNTVNSQLIFYRAYLNDFTLAEPAGQIFLMNCSNGLITGQNMSDVEICMDVRSCDNLTITSSSFTDSNRGINIIESSYIRLENNFVEDFEKFAVNIEDSHHSEIVNNSIIYNPKKSLEISGHHISIQGNYFRNNKYAISITGDNYEISSNELWRNGIGIVLYQTEETIIRDNNCTDGYDSGIHLIESVNNSIRENLIENNWRYGVHLEYSDMNDFLSNTIIRNHEIGLFFEHSDNNSITDTLIRNAYALGINLSDSKDTTISENNIKGNEIGIWIHHGSDTTRIFNNDIHSNSESGINASFYNGERIDVEQNWWGDGTGPYHSENNTLGEGDTIIGNVDFDPWLAKRMNDVPVATIISLPPDPAFSGDMIPFAAYVDDDDLIVSFVWVSDLDGEFYNGTDDSISSSTLSPGSHTIILRVMDYLGEWSNDVNISLNIVQDRDGDQVPDGDDAFPADPAASLDLDGDGYPDEWNEGKYQADSTSGLRLDAYPDDPDRWEPIEEHDNGNDGLENIFLAALVCTGIAVGILVFVKRKS